LTIPHKIVINLQDFGNTKEDSHYILQDFDNTMQDFGNTWLDYEDF
jgi:calcineurin-like phosphoesterase family protein